MQIVDKCWVGCSDECLPLTVAASALGSLQMVQQPPNLSAPDADRFATSSLLRLGQTMSSFAVLQKLQHHFVQHCTLQFALWN